MRRARRCARRRVTRRPPPYSHCRCRWLPWPCSPYMPVRTGRMRCRPAPTRQAPVESQHPPPHSAAQPEPASGIGLLQILMGSVGATGSGAHVSPGVKHSESDEQSWRGPMADDGQGPTWQLVVIEIVPQHTVPLRQVALLVQVTPPAPLELAPMAPPPVLDPPLLLENPPLETPLLFPPDPPPVPLPPLIPLSSPCEPPPAPSRLDASAPGSELASSLPPHADPTMATNSPSRTRSGGESGWQINHVTRSGRPRGRRSLRQEVVAQRRRTVPAARQPGRARTLAPGGPQGACRVSRFRLRCLRVADREGDVVG